MNEGPNKKVDLKSHNKNEKPMIVTVQPAVGVSYADLPKHIEITTCTPGDAKAKKDAE